jgi:hypothetical protein
MSEGENDVESGSLSQNVIPENYMFKLGTMLAQKRRQITHAASLLRANHVKAWDAKPLA